MDSAGRPSTIVLKSQSGRYDEARAGGAIKPGMLIERTATGTVVAHATAGGGGEVMVAVEDALQGKTIDDAYASGDLVRYYFLLPGDECMLLLVDEQNIANNGPLKSDGAGRVIAQGGTGQIIARAVEALNLTGATGDDHIKARVIFA